MILSPLQQHSGRVTFRLQFPLSTQLGLMTASQFQPCLLSCSTCVNKIHCNRCLFYLLQVLKTGNTFKTTSYSYWMGDWRVPNFVTQSSSCYVEIYALIYLQEPTLQMCETVTSEFERKEKKVTNKGSLGSITASIILMIDMRWRRMLVIQSKELQEAKKCKSNGSLILNCR